MTDKETKCVIVADENLPAGLLANTTAILGISLGRSVPECVGEDVHDASGKVHTGIITVPVPILKGNSTKIRDLREKLFSDDFAELTVVDFSDVAQSCTVYSDYIEKAGNTIEEEHTYLGVVIYGDKKKVNKLTGNLPLLR
ncbi:MAG: DUF2000 domain-containing protein [Anaerolineaceae bacterium]|nr:DUF2000 domain-containing protein [Anaerolineaceae bacterium]